MIFRILFHILHFLVTLIGFFIDNISKCLYSLKSTFFATNLSNIAKDATHLDKRPHHLGVIFTEPHLSISDISKVIYWCFALGIPHLSLYDHQGNLKKRKIQVEENARKHLIASHSHSDVGKIIVRDSYACKNAEHKNKNLQVALLSVVDGRQSVVEFTKHLARLVSNGQLKSPDIEPNNVDTLMQEQSNIADPDLIIRFGPTASLMGYLPWQVRLTEILTLPSHHHIDYSSFYKLISSYGCIKQRFGT